MAPAYDARDYSSWDRAVAKAKLARPKVNGPMPMADGTTRYTVIGSAGDTYTVTVDRDHDLSCDCKAGQSGLADYHSAAVWLLLPRCANCRDSVVDYPGRWCSGCTNQDVACRAQLQDDIAALMAAHPSYYLPTAISAVRAHLR